MTHRKSRSRNKLKPRELGLAVLESYQKPPSIPTERQQWISHTGKKQRVKYLRRECADILSSQDPQVIEVLTKAKEFLAGKFEEYGLLMMIHQGKETADSTGLSFVETFDYILEKMKSDLEKEANSGETAANDTRE